MVLETRRLILRKMEASDLDFLAALLGDAEVMRYYPKPMDRAEAEVWYEKTRSFYERAGHGFWLAVSKETGQPVGQVGLLPKEINGLPEVEVAYMLDRRHWRQGLATEAAGACIEYGLRVLKLPRVVCMIRPENRPSLGVAAKLDLHLVGETTHLGFLHHLFECREYGERREIPDPGLKDA